MADEAAASTRKRELTLFLFLALVLAPILAVIVVAGYGFCVWMYQLVAGPPSV
jgi:nitrate reductase NapE